MTFEDVFYHFLTENSVIVKSPDELDSLRGLLDSNELSLRSFLDTGDELLDCIVDVAGEEAVCEDFDEAMIRKAFSLGYYPMAFSKKIQTKGEMERYGLSGMNVSKEFLALKYHRIKMIVTFDRNLTGQGGRPLRTGNRLRIPKNFRSLVRNRFSGCTLTFNKAFDQCVECLLDSYPETWLLPGLVEKYRAIHENPDGRVSVDSVEVWRDGKLVAGEIGFITGNAYASLSGFHREKDSGTVQMCALGLFLRDSGFAYWDLGMELDYKFRYGAERFSRDAQEELFAAVSPERIVLPKDEIPLTDFLSRL